MSASNTPDPSSNTALPYRGRFAPSPTGPLHAGSLLSAVCSFLEARRHDGHWQVRIDDIDPPREVAGAADAILRSLDAHGLHADDTIVFQSRRQAVYLGALDRLRDAGLLFPCACTRRELRARATAGPNGPLYPGTCRDGLPPGREARAWRWRVNQAEDLFEDRFQGLVRTRLAETVGDFVVRRADGLLAYNLAAAVDDGSREVSHVIRGHDLLWCTPPQRLIQQALGLRSPEYGHLPVLVDPQGQKLSKQQGAPALDDRSAPANLWLALQRLQQEPPAALRRASLATLWQWAQAHWTPDRLQGRETIRIDHGGAIGD